MKKIISGTIIMLFFLLKITIHSNCSNKNKYYSLNYLFKNFIKNINNNEFESWINPVNMDDILNIPGFELGRITSNGKYLFFRNNRNLNFHYANTDIFEDLKNNINKKNFGGLHE